LSPFELPTTGLQLWPQLGGQKSLGGFCFKQAAKKLLQRFQPGPGLVEVQQHQHPCGLDQAPGGTQQGPAFIPGKFMESQAQLDAGPGRWGQGWLFGQALHQPQARMAPGGQLQGPIRDI
jgi:hypothetical protein